jgi:peptidoglycan/LPS O-acetylase OafA/YrhL
MKQFWIRRARRLLPALFTMMTAFTIWVRSSIATCSASCAAT